MSLGNLLLHPQRLQRETGGEPKLKAAQDLLRLLTLLAEDAADEGELTAIGPQLLSRIGSRIQFQVGDGVVDVQAALKIRLQPLFVFLEALEDTRQTTTPPTS